MALHFRLSIEQAPKNEKERLEMQSIPYANIVGSVMYAMIGTRTDVAQAISTTSRFMSNHGKEHWLALRWILRYHTGAGNIGILFKADANTKNDALMGFVIVILQVALTPESPNLDTSSPYLVWL